MADMTIAIKVDPGAALPAIKKVEDGLSAAERKAKEASKAMTDGMRKMGDAASSAADDIEMEARMMERATGRARDFGEQIAALKRLHDQGKINNEQYIQTLQKMGVQFEHTAEQAERLRREQSQLAMNTIGFSGGAPQGPGFQERISSGVGMFAAGGAVTAGALAIGGKANEIRQHHKDMEDQLITLENQARKFADSGKSVNDVLNEQSKLAVQLHSTLGPAMALYDDVGDAVDELGLSQKQLTELTRTLGEGAALANKPMDAAGAIMSRLSIAMTTGQDGAREMKAILRDFPELGGALAKTWKTNKDGVLDMVTSGKKNLRDIIGVWTDYADSIHSAHDAMKIQNADQKKMFQEQAQLSGLGGSMDAMLAPTANNAKMLQQWREVGMGSAFGVTRITMFSDISEQLREMREEWVRTEGAINGGAAWAAAAAATERLNDGLKGIVDTLGDVGNAMQGSQFFRVMGMRQARDSEIKQAKQDLDDLNEAQKFGTYSTQQYAEKKRRLEEIITGVTKAHAAQRKELTLEQKLMEEIEGPQRRANAELMELTQLWMRGAITLEQYNRATEKRRDLLLEVGALEAKSVTGGSIVRQDMRGGSFADSLEAPGVVDYTAGVGSTEALMGGQGVYDRGAFNAGLAEMAAASKEFSAKMKGDAKKAAQETAAAWAGAAGDVVGSFARMAMEGEMTFGDMLEQTLRKAAMLALQLAATQVGGGPAGSFVGSLFGALGGGANGFDYVANSSAMQLPGFARGGDAMTMGHGGTDSKLAMFRITPGESLHVRTPHQRMAEADEARKAARSGGSGPTRVNVIVQSDPREVTAAMGTYEGKRAAVRLNRSGSWRR